MSKVSELNIENEAAKAAFVEWWGTMEAQGFRYGFEALCNVWVGFDDGRADLARKVLETISALSIDEQYSPHYRNGFHKGVNDAEVALRGLFRKAGVDVDGESK